METIDKKPAVSGTVKKTPWCRGCRKPRSVVEGEKTPLSRAGCLPTKNPVESRTEKNPAVSSADKKPRRVEDREKTPSVVGREKNQWCRYARSARLTSARSARASRCPRWRSVRYPRAYRSRLTGSVPPRLTAPPGAPLGGPSSPSPSVAGTPAFCGASCGRCQQAFGLNFREGCPTPRWLSNEHTLGLCAHWPIFVRKRLREAVTAPERPSWGGRGESLVRSAPQFPRPCAASHGSGLRPSRLGNTHPGPKPTHAPSGVSPLPGVRLAANNWRTRARPAASSTLRPAPLSAPLARGSRSAGLR